MLYRMPFDGAPVSAVGVAGRPPDQLAFFEDAHDHLNVVVAHENDAVTLLRLPLSSFSDGSLDAPTWAYRPIARGGAVVRGAAEKIGFPTARIIMLALQMWEPLAVTVIAEMLVSLTVLFVVSKGQRLGMLLKGILVTPMRYVLMAMDMVTTLRFAIDLWITGNRKWRK